MLIVLIGFCNLATLYLNLLRTYSFASRAYASYVLAEKGDQQPRSLSVAYLKPINQRENDDFITDSIRALIKQKDSFDKVYGDCADSRYALSVPDEKGTLAELLDFVGE